MPTSPGNLANSGAGQAALRSIAADSWAKRVLDLVLASAALLFLAPLMIVTAAAIWVESGGPMLFRQTRTGLSGRAFKIFKFRSMTVVEDGVSAFRQATADDPRITGVGSFIRRTSIDELPQLLNVLLGEMSLVGPRPHVPALDARFAGVTDYEQRVLVKPGITGWAQVCGHRGETRHVNDMAARVAHDVDYVRRWSLLFDLEILAKTAIVVPFSGKAF